MLRKLIAIAAVLLCTTAAYPDGMLLVPSATLGHYAEQNQAAVVTVDRDWTAAVDLFISLSTSSEKPEEVHFLLPLQTLPKGFQAQELELAQFKSERLGPLDRLLIEGDVREREANANIACAYVLSSFLAGPGAPILDLAMKGQYRVLQHRVLHRVLYTGPKWQSRETKALSELPATAVSVRTEHTAADIYPSLKPDQVAALAKLPELPEITRKTLSQYAGRPFALVTLRLTPIAPSPPRVGGLHFRDPFARDRFTASVESSVDSSVPMGVHFSFVQQLLPEKGATSYRYDFPLGTGQAWANPIGSTMVYVTGPDSLRLTVRFPDRPTTDQIAASHFGVSGAISAVANGRQVYAARYGADTGGANESRDVEIRLLAHGKPEAVARRDAARRRTSATCAAFPLSALLCWLIALRLFLPWRQGQGVARRAWAAGQSWLIAQGLLLPVLAGGLALPLLKYSAVFERVIPRWYWASWVWWFVEDDAWRFRLQYGIPLTLAIVLWIGTLWYVARKTRATFPGLLWRLPLAAAFSGGIYVLVGYLLGVAFVHTSLGYQ